MTCHLSSSLHSVAVTLDIVDVHYTPIYCFQNFSLFLSVLLSPFYDESKKRLGFANSRVVLNQLSIVKVGLAQTDSCYSQTPRIVVDGTAFSPVVNDWTSLFVQNLFLMARHIAPHFLLILLGEISFSTHPFPSSLAKLWLNWILFSTCGKLYVIKF